MKTATQCKWETDRKVGYKYKDQLDLIENQIETAIENLEYQIEIPNFNDDSLKKYLKTLGYDVYSPMVENEYGVYKILKDKLVISW